MSTTHTPPRELLVLTEQEMESGKVVDFLAGQVGVFTHRSPEKETQNEDAAAVARLGGDVGVLAVADGVGGLPGGAQASQVALRELMKQVMKAELDKPSSLRTAILDGFESANKAVLGIASGSGTTLAVAEIRDGHVRPYHTGDSLILVTGQRGKVKLQIVPHSPVGYAIEAGMLDEQEAMVHEDRHLVSNIIGSADMRIEIGSLMALDERDTVVLASDGLSDNLAIGEIVDRARTGSMQESIDSLHSLAHRRMTKPSEGKPSKPDDLTFLVFRGWSKPPEGSDDE